jgi:hypothetical protein
MKNMKTINNRLKELGLKMSGEFDFKNGIWSLNVERIEDCKDCDIQMENGFKWSDLKAQLEVEGMI